MRTFAQKSHNLSYLRQHSPSITLWETVLENFICGWFYHVPDILKCSHKFPSHTLMLLYCQNKCLSLSSTFFLLSSGSIAGPSRSNLSASAADEKRTRFSMKGGSFLAQLREEREWGMNGRCIWVHDSRHGEEGWREATKNRIPYRVSANTFPVPSLAPVITQRQRHTSWHASSTSS